MFTRLFPIVISSSVLFSASVFSEANDEKEKPKVVINGVIMMDYGVLDKTISKSDEGSTFETEIRRAKVSFKHRFEQDWEAKLKISYNEAQSESEVEDAYLKYSGLDNIDVTIGKYDDPFGLEYSTSSGAVTFLERSMMTNAFTFGRNKGVKLTSASDRSTWALSIADIDSESNENNPYLVTGRMTFAPSINQDNLLHLGVGASLVSMDGETFEIDERVEIHSSEKVIGSGKIITDTVQKTGAEFAWVGGPSSIQAEYMAVSIEGIDRADDADFDGYYLQASYFLTADSRPYKNGRFIGVKPSSKTGAYELTARYSTLDTQEVVGGSEINTGTLGLNYYYSENFRYVTNLLYTESSETDDNGMAIAVRAQYSF